MSADSSNISLQDESFIDSTAALSHQLFHGTTWHSRLLPSVHKFAYSYRYWGINLTALVAGQALPEVAFSLEDSIKDKNSLKSKLFNNRMLNHQLLKKLSLFSAQHKAVQQFYAHDYLQNMNSHKDEVINASRVDLNAKSVQLANKQLLQRLVKAFIDQTGSAPTGDILGLVVCRNMGMYFSPVNFYLGFDNEQNPSHLLAEVSNTPWDKRHYYGFLLQGADSEFYHNKDFHVSPFNPINQLYKWQVNVARQQDCLRVRIAIDISDARGEVLKTGIKMTGVPMTATIIRTSLRKNPLMNMTSLTRIYWHAFKLYAIKRVPYVGYDEKLADSKQRL